MPERKRIMLVGEAFGEREEQKGRPFVGPSGALLDAFLSAAGIARNECYLTNVFNLRPEANKILTLCGPKADGIPGYPSLQKSKYVSLEYKSEVDRLLREVNEVNPNLIVALGSTACWALLKAPSIKKLRGAPSLSITGHKVLPTYHPAAVLREMKLRPIVYSDFKKIALEADFPEIRRPAREIWTEPNLSDIVKFDAYIQEMDRLSVDIETWNRQITIFGIGDRNRVLVIPFIWRGTKDRNYWPTLEAELFVWGYIRKWLFSGKPLVGQNFLYDANYLWSKYGLPALNIEGDTMLLHHAMQPEMEKSLGFLGSIYTNEPSWKFMRKGITTLKKED